MKRQLPVLLMITALAAPAVLAIDANHAPNASFEADANGDVYPDGWGPAVGSPSNMNCEAKWSHDWLEGLRSLHIEINEVGPGGVCSVTSEKFSLFGGTFRVGGFAKGTFQAYIGFNLHCLDSNGNPTGGTQPIDAALGHHAWTPQYEYRTCPAGTTQATLQLYLMDRRAQTDADGEDAWFDVVSVTRA